ncbi:MAG: MlaA family lipoprotein [Erythrobacter sp.]
MAISLASAVLLAASAAQAEPPPPPPEPAVEAATPAASEQPPEVPPASGNNIIVSAEAREPLKDPLASVNEATFEVTQKVDEALVAPLAEAYEEELPSPLRKGLRNFFRNLMEPVNALNFLFQLKPGKAVETLGRFAINSTVGAAGLFDVAKKEPFKLPYRRNTFGNTLGYYGVGPGPFLVVPLVGATSLRDLIGIGIDQSVLPFAVGAPFNTPYYALPAFTVNSLEFRIKFDERIDQINTSDDPYYAMRETYLCQREADIAALKNRPPPRDCSIEAIMAGPEGAAETAVPAAIEGATPEAVQNAAETVQSAAETGQGEAGQAANAPEPAPGIEFISREVVQPLPQG